MVTTEAETTGAGPAQRERASQRRRPELGDFLKARRARVTPAEVGLAPGGRRRTPGLRREEVALLAGVGVTWYTWLEQGRPINASAQVLDAVAHTLQLAEAEREHLYRLAESIPVRAGGGAPIVPPDLHEVLQDLSSVPAVIVNERWDVIANNTAHENLFWWWHAQKCLHKNLLWCSITEPSARDQLVNYDEEVPYMVARMRAAYGKHIGDPEWNEDIARLSRLSPEFARLWARHDVAEPQARIRQFKLSGIGLMSLRTTELHSPIHQGMCVIAYTPADETTRARLAAAIVPRPEPARP